MSKEKEKEKEKKKNTRKKKNKNKQEIHTCQGCQQLVKEYMRIVPMSSTQCSIACCRHIHSMDALYYCNENCMNQHCYWNMDWKKCCLHIETECMVCKFPFEDLIPCSIFKIGG
jgi:hypothetical protein